VDQELNVLALVKGDHRFIFVYDDQAQPALACLLNAWAVDPRLTFSTFDAAVLAQKSREQIAAFSEGPPPRPSLSALDADAGE
jgi:hypothetical protein